MILCWLLSLWWWFIGRNCLTAEMIETVVAVATVLPVVPVVTVQVLVVVVVEEEVDAEK